MDKQADRQMKNGSKKNRLGATKKMKSVTENSTLTTEWPIFPLFPTDGKKI
jgi:hypothetical protein